MKSHILYNPLAGHGISTGYLNILKNTVDGEAVLEDLTRIECLSSHLMGIHEEDKIIICGGDGTLNQFVNLVDIDKFPHEIYYYASGSGNDFLHDIAGNGEKTLIPIRRYLENLPTVTVKGESRKFLNGVGYGIDGYCCEVGDAQRASSEKPVNYTAIAIKGLLFCYKPTSATVTVDGKEYSYKKVWIAPTMNGRCYGGGMMPTPKQDRLNPEGKVSLMIFHGTGKLKTLMIFPSIFKGEHVKHTEAVSIHEGKEITVKFDGPRPLQIDGETVLDVTEYTVHAAITAKV